MKELEMPTTDHSHRQADSRMAVEDLSHLCLRVYILDSGRVAGLRIGDRPWRTCRVGLTVGHGVLPSGAATDPWGPFSHHRLAGEVGQRNLVVSRCRSGHMLTCRAELRALSIAVTVTI